MKQPKLILRTAILTLVLALSSTLFAQEPSPSPTPPSGPMVQLSLIVTDEKDNALNNVNKDDLRLVENKVEQKVLSVTADARPVDLGIVIDCSGSFRSLMASTLEAVRVIIVNHHPDDEIFIERFVSADRIETLQEFTSDTNILVDSLKKIVIEGGQSAVIDGVYLAAQHVAEHNRKPDRRKALVIFTDGEDRNSYYTQAKLLALLHKEKVQVFVVGIVIDLDETRSLLRPSPREKATKLLNTIAEETGGRVFLPKDKRQLIESIVQIIHDLRGQFRITYQSTHGDKKDLRKADVKLVLPSGEKRKAIVSRGYEIKL